MTALQSFYGLLSNLPVVEALLAGEPSAEFRTRSRFESIARSERFLGAQVPQVSLFRAPRPFAKADMGAPVASC